MCVLRRELGRGARAPRVVELRERRAQRARVRLRDLAHLRRMRLRRARRLRGQRLLPRSPRGQRLLQPAGARARVARRLRRRRARLPERRLQLRDAPAQRALGRLRRARGARGAARGARRNRVLHKLVEHGQRCGVPRRALEEGRARAAALALKRRKVRELAGREPQLHVRQELADERARAVLADARVLRTKRVPARCEVLLELRHLPVPTLRLQRRAAVPEAHVRPPRLARVPLRQLAAPERHARAQRGGGRVVRRERGGLVPRKLRVADRCPDVGDARRWRRARVEDAHVRLCERREHAPAQRRARDGLDLCVAQHAVAQRQKLPPRGQARAAAGRGRLGGTEWAAGIVRRAARGGEWEAVAVEEEAAERGARLALPAARRRGAHGEPPEVLERLLEVLARRAARSHARGRDLRGGRAVGDDLDGRAPEREVVQEPEQLGHLVRELLRVLVLLLAAHPHRVDQERAARPEAVYGLVGQRARRRVHHERREERGERKHAVVPPPERVVAPQALDLQHQRVHLGPVRRPRRDRLGPQVHAQAARLDRLRVRARIFGRLKRLLEEPSLRQRVPLSHGNAGGGARAACRGVG